MKIDSHQHFWRYQESEFPWIGSEHLALKRDFLPADLQLILQENQIDGSIAVQACQTLAETDWLLALAEQNPFIRGVIGWLPLCDPNVESLIEQYAAHSKLVGIRHVVHDEPDDQFILRADFNEGIGRLASRDLVYDILIFEKHLPATIAFVDRHPNLQFVVDHIAKPKIRAGNFDQEWGTNLLELSRRPNVACKLSGMVTEVAAPQWDRQLLAPYFDTALEAFGPERLLFGSDWPVCLLRSDYANWVHTVQAAIDELSEREQSLIWGENAARIYTLK